MCPLYLKKGGNILFFKNFQQLLFNKLNRVPPFHVLWESKKAYIIPFKSVFNVIYAISMMIILKSHCLEFMLHKSRVLFYDGKSVL